MDPKPEPLPVADAAAAAPPPPVETGGAKREREPTRYGDWEINGKCVDF